MANTQKEKARACTECTRRKQKCNHKWPCDHCQKRKVADKCRFKDTNRHHTRKAEREGWAKGKWRLNRHRTVASMPSYMLLSLTTQDGVVETSSREYFKDPKISPQLRRALQVVPPRPYIDTLIQNFFDNVNIHCIVYPKTFLEQYQQWWTARTENKPLSVQWTCLLLMVCACASQYTEDDLQGKLKIDSGDAIQRLTEQYHEAARELSRTIPIGYNHLINIQQLLHSCYWFMSEARFIEFWHVLNLAIREAQELHIHQESKAEIVTEFELEIQRRVWCVMDIWDYQSSTLLGRPMLIDRSDCDVGLPSPSLEEARHSPLLHARMQSNLIQHLFDRFGRTKNITDPTDIREYVGIIKKWTKDFLHPFDMHQTDQSLDWVAVHRHYVHIMAFSMLLNPIRPFFARAFTSLSLHTELTIRNDGISYCLEFMVSLRRFFNSVYPHVARFPFALLFIFDTAAGLCSAVLHDKHHTLPVREDVFRAIDDAHTMLRRLRMVTKSAETSYRILSRIMKRLSRTVEGQTCPRTAYPPKSTASPGLSRLGECPWRTFYRPHASSLSVPEVSPLPTEWNVLGKSVDLEAYGIPLHPVTRYNNRNFRNSPLDRLRGGSPTNRFQNLQALEKQASRVAFEDNATKKLPAHVRSLYLWIYGMNEVGVWAVSLSELDNIDVFISSTILESQIGALRPQVDKHT